MKKLFSKIELEDMLDVCNVRLSSNKPCRHCEYFLKCEKMYAYLDCLPKDEQDRINHSWHKN